jgi:CRP-like cAMP-binding protein
MYNEAEYHKIFDNYYAQTRLIFAEIENIERFDKEIVLNPVKLKKNEYLLRANEYCRNISYLKSGILRHFYINDSTEIITSFAFSGDVSTVLRSLIHNEPSREYIQAITDCEISSISISNYQLLKAKYPMLAKIDAYITQLYALILEERLFSLKFHTAAERYQILLKREPMIIKQVPLTFIASYLGITLETLSRIRAQR